MHKVLIKILQGSVVTQAVLWANYIGYPLIVGSSKAIAVVIRLAF